MVTTATRPESRALDLDNTRDPRFMPLLLERMDSATVEMRRIELELGTKRRALAEQQRHLSERADALKADIADDLDEKGKPNFSNAESRKAELNRRLRKDGIALSHQRVVDQFEVDLAGFEVEFEYQRRTRANRITAMEFAAAQLQCWAAERKQEMVR